MNEYINLTLDNIDEEHICCAIGDPKHQEGVNKKKEWIKNKLRYGANKKLSPTVQLLPITFKPCRLISLKLLTISGLSNTRVVANKHQLVLLLPYAIKSAYQE